MVRIDIQDHLGGESLHRPEVLASKIIAAMQMHDEVEIYTEETFSAEDVGLIKLLNNLVKFHGWDHNRISLKYNNHKEPYTIKDFAASVAIEGDPSAPYFYESDYKEIPWNREKIFGMFIGRLSLSRLYAIDRLKTFKYKDMGLSSMNQSPAEIKDNNVLLEFLKTTDKKWSNIKDWEKYSDVGEIIQPPILPPENLWRWDKVYEKIGIEIVCETGEDYSVHSLTEKLLRPMLYRRPFILIGSPGLCKALTDKDSHIVKNLQLSYPIMMFQHVIPLDYDNLAGKERVDAVFDILEDLISSGKMDTIHHECRYDIRVNYKVACDYLKTGFGMTRR